jgi:quinol monooxygenase YgiN
MITRIVKMSFQENLAEKFIPIFENSCHKIRAFDGCLSLTLHRDKNNECIFFTYSIWENEQALENYRESLLFKTTWAATKVLFEKKPEAWTLETLHQLH